MSLDSLKRKLEYKRYRVDVRYKFYEMKNYARDLGISTPPNLMWLNSALGWNAKAVDSLADRLQFVGFRSDTDFFRIDQIFKLNNPDVLAYSAINGALIASCSFIYISEVDNYPRLQVIDGGNATGDIDPTTGLLKEGYAVLERDESGNPLTEAYFTADSTAIYSDGQLVQEIPNPARYPLLVPVIFRPDAKRPFGHSRISRACMAYTSAALRTLKRSEVSAEFFSFPQRYVTGLDQDHDKLDKWKATMSSLLSFEISEDGTDHVKLGQFAQQSMTPHIDQLKMFASLFAGETGLTLDDLGFATANPSSAEAIKAAHENLRLTARRAQVSFGAAFLNAGLVAASVRDRQPYLRYQLYETVPVWRPLFEPDASMLGAIGDGLSKLQVAFPDAITRETLTELVGF